MFGRKKLKAKIFELENELILSQNTIKGLKCKDEENIFLRKANKDISIENANLKKQVREQTEADLLFVSAQICLKLLQGEKKEKLGSILEQQQIMQQRVAAMAAMAAMPSSGLYHSSIYGRSPDLFSFLGLSGSRLD